MCPPAAVPAAAAAGSAAAGTGAAATAAATTAAMTQMMYASLAISALTSGVGFMQQMEQSNAQNAYQKSMAEAHNAAAEHNADMAFQDMREQTTAEHIAQMQREEATAQEVQRIERERKEAMGTALASSEGAGQSMDFLMGDYMRQEARYRNSLKTQLRMDTVQSGISIDGFRRTAENRANGSQGYVPNPVSQPNPLSAIVGFGGKAFGAYDKYSEQGKYRII